MTSKATYESNRMRSEEMAITADRIVYGNIYTVDKDQPTA